MENFIKIFAVPASLLLMGCQNPEPINTKYLDLPERLGLKNVVVSNSTITVSDELHSVVFTEGRRVAKIDGVSYYLNFTNEYSQVDLDAMRFAILAPPMANNTPLRICLDAGHGGKDSGCLSPDGTVMEKNITLDLLRRVKKGLQNQPNIEVVFATRDVDKTLTLAERTKFAEDNRVDCFVSLHVNNSKNTEANGVEVFALPEIGATGSNSESPARPRQKGHDAIMGSTRLAFLLQKNLLNIKETPGDRGVKRAYFYVLREIKCPAALIEIGFLSNDVERAKLLRTDYLDFLADAVIKGILEFSAAK